MSLIQCATDRLGFDASEDITESSFQDVRIFLDQHGSQMTLYEAPLAIRASGYHVIKGLLLLPFDSPFTLVTDAVDSFITVDIATAEGYIPFSIKYHR